MTETVAAPRQPPQRLLLGPGPSPVHDDVLQAQARPLVGHLDPWWHQVTGEIATMLRAIFQTANAATFAISGTGSAGMQTALANVLEPGDTIIVGSNGAFGARIADAAQRLGARVETITADWGAVIDPDAVAAAIAAHPQARAVALVHAETSTGAWQPLAEVGALLAATDTLFIVDAVTSLGGVPVAVDADGCDVVFSGTQKCLSVPPGLAPITFSDKAWQRITTRTTPVSSWYFDAQLIADYWQDGAYHHTVPVSALLGLHEGLRRVLDEGLARRWARHDEVGRLFQSHLADRDAAIVASPHHRLPQLTAFFLPDGVDDVRARRDLLESHGIEVGGGLGPLASAVWRVGLLGEGATHDNVDRLFDAIDDVVGW